MNHQKRVNEWRRFLSESSVQNAEISDEVLALLFSDEISEILAGHALNENLKDRAKSLAKKYALPLTVATALLAGGLSGKELADMRNASQTSAAAQADSAEPHSMAYYRGSKPPGYSDLNNTQSIEKAWNDLDSLQRTRAPVHGSIPVAMGGEVVHLQFAHIPTSELSPSTILPMSLMTAQDYKDMLEARLARNDQELIYLKNMIFGDTGRWASGTGNEHFRVEGRTALLPPEWSIAHEVYATAVETRLIELVDHIRENPEDQDLIFQQIGVSSDVEFHEFVNDQLYKIGRQ